MAVSLSIDLTDATFADLKVPLRVIAASIERAAEQAFSSLVGLELRPRKAREASELWRRVGEAVGTERRDGLWQHPDLLPVGEDLENPAAVIDRLLDESTGDPGGVDEIERFLRESGGGSDGRDDPGPEEPRPGA